MDGLTDGWMFMWDLGGAGGLGAGWLTDERKVGRSG
jgi:hypothetical protein